jgi:hypothetical protein
VDLFAPVPYVQALRRLTHDRAGRISGPIDLLPPLVSNASGFRDLRSINVLTPADTYEFVSELVAPSQGVTWILADPDPLLVATSAGADLADVRYVLARSALSEDALPAAVRGEIGTRRLRRLLASLDRYSIATARLWGGVHAFGGERRVHWTCSTPCRFRLDFRSLPEQLAIGLGSDATIAAEVAVRLRQAGVATELLRDGAGLAPDAPAWRDLRVDLAASGALQAARVAPGSAATIEVEIDSQPPATVFVGGLGPSPGEAAEQALVVRETEARRRAFAALVLRYADATAFVYENPRVAGAAYFATDLATVVGREAVLDELATAQGRRIAVFARRDLGAVSLPERSSGEALVSVDDDARVLLETSSGTGGVVVVPRLYTSGWRTTIDQNPVPTLRANGALLAFVAPPGVHRVEIRYAPRSFWIGAALSLMALVVWSLRSVAGRV